VPPRKAALFDNNFYIKMSNSSSFSLTGGIKTSIEHQEADGPPRKKARGPLSNDIADMLFGFGDSWPPNSQTVNLVEALVTDYIKDLGARALQVADLRPDGKLDKECFLYLVRKDRSKFQRVNKLLVANKEIKQAQIIEEHDEVKQKAMKEEAEPAETTGKRKHERSAE